jgi:hypothetical protein
VTIEQKIKVTESRSHGATVIALRLPPNAHGLQKITLHRGRQTMRQARTARLSRIVSPRSAPILRNSLIDMLILSVLTCVL